MPLSDEIDMNALATLVVAWRSGRNAYVRVVKAGGDVTEALREYAKTAIDKIAHGQGRSYNPDDEQEDECPFLTTDRSELLDTALLEQLNLGASLPWATSDEIRKQTLALYGLLVGNDPDSRITFVRKGNPVRLATKSVVGVFDQTLTRVRQPILAFDSTFDVVFRGNASGSCIRRTSKGYSRRATRYSRKRQNGPSRSAVTCPWLTIVNSGLPNGYGKTQLCDAKSKAS
jgi:hypothetical protein